MSRLRAFRVIAHAFTLTQESVISLPLCRGAISQARVAAPVFVVPEEEGEAGPRPASQSGCQSQPLVTIGGGAFGDLPAQAAKLSNARVAIAATASFFMEAPGFDPPWQLWGILRH